MIDATDGDGSAVPTGTRFADDVRTVRVAMRATRQRSAYRADGQTHPDRGADREKPSEAADTLRAPPPPAIRNSELLRLNTGELVYAGTSPA